MRRGPLAALGAIALLSGSCTEPGTRFTQPQTLGGVTVSPARLNAGKAAFETYCSGCHGMAGDGRGPASPALRPPPRDFRLGKFKFAAVPSGQLPHDEDLLRTIQEGLRGTAMRSWRDIPEKDLLDIIQYLKTLSPRWRGRQPGERIVPGPDPWQGRRPEAESRGLRVYHGLAQCYTCHPAYESEPVIQAASRELLGREVVLRADPFHPVPKESDYGVKLVPPDFTRDVVRSGETLADLYRSIASGIGGTAMPTWKGVLPDEDLWALAYYVRSLIDQRGTPEADRRRTALESSHLTMSEASAP